MDKNIFSALIKARAEFPEIQKTRKARVVTKTGAKYEYNYADLGDILSAITRPLVSQGLMLIQTVNTSDTGEDWLATKIVAESGEEMELGRLRMTNNEDPQKFGAELTYLRRYAACAALGICPEDDTDASDMGQTELGAADARLGAPGSVKPKSDDRRDRLDRAFSKSGWSTEQMRALIKGAFGVSSSADLDAAGLESVIAHITNNPPGAPHPFQMDRPETSK